MESPIVPSRVVIAYDATKERGIHELSLTIDRIKLRGGILRPGDSLVVLGVLHKMINPMGYLVKACLDSFAGTNIRLMEEEVKRKVDSYVLLLLRSAEIYDHEKISIEVKVTAGTPMKQVIFQDSINCNASWVVLDRHLRKDLTFYLKHIPCKLALIQDNLSVEVVRPHTTSELDGIEHKVFFSLTKIVPLVNYPSSEQNDQSSITCRSFSISVSSLDNSNTPKPHGLTLPSDTSKENILFLDSKSLNTKDKSGTLYAASAMVSPMRNQDIPRLMNSGAPIICSVCEVRTELYVKDSMKYSFSEIQLATDDFSKENLLGEGGYGHVYKGKLKDGQLIAAKVRKEASSQGFAEFHSEIYILNFARHKNIVMLLGFCCRENLNILVYEYICNKSLDWHLFGKGPNTLEWHQRYTIAIGIAKGLRFLHEECRGGPVIHRDIRPSNILLTHDFVPMIGDFGLARWKTGEEDIQTRILGTLGYLAPEYAENGIVSVRTDVYAFGVILLQLISGRRVVDTKRADGQQSIRQWADPLIERLALHELIDPWLGESYDTYELYLMARTAHLCVQIAPELRPSMGEVMRLLEVEKASIYQATPS